jgi:hypothetical protein
MMIAKVGTKNSPTGGGHSVGWGLKATELSYIPNDLLLFTDELWS